MSKETQDRDYQWFLEHKNRLRHEYGECNVVVSHEKVIGTYSDYAEAVHETEKTIPLGEFIVQHTGPDSVWIMGTFVNI